MGAAAREDGRPRRPSDVRERGCTHPAFSERPARSNGDARANPGVPASAATRGSPQRSGPRAPARRSSRPSASQHVASTVSLLGPPFMLAALLMDAWVEDCGEPTTICLQINVAEHASVSRSGAQPTVPGQLQSPCVPGPRPCCERSCLDRSWDDKRGHEVLFADVPGSQVFEVAPALAAGESRLAAAWKNRGNRGATSGCVVERFEQSDVSEVLRAARGALHLERRASAAKSSRASKVPGFLTGWGSCVWWRRGHRREARRRRRSSSTPAPGARPSGAAEQRAACRRRRAGREQRLRPVGPWRVRVPPAMSPDQRTGIQDRLGSSLRKSTWSHGVDEICPRTAQKRGARTRSPPRSRCDRVGIGRFRPIPGSR
jgi:hypothetical protein